MKLRAGPADTARAGHRHEEFELTKREARFWHEATLPQFYRKNVTDYCASVNHMTVLTMGVDRGESPHRNQGRSHDIDI